MVSGAEQTYNFKGTNSMPGGIKVGVETGLQLSYDFNDKISANVQAGLYVNTGGRSGDSKTETEITLPDGSTTTNTTARPSKWMDTEIGVAPRRGIVSLGIRRKF